MAIERYYLICKANEAKTKLNLSNRKKVYLLIVSGSLLMFVTMLIDVAVHHPKFVSYQFSQMGKSFGQTIDDLAKD